MFHNALGQLDVIFGAGELREIWERDMLKNRRCGCGVPFKEGKVWRRTLDEGLGGLHRIDAHEMTRRRNSIRNRHFQLALLPWNKKPLKSRLGGSPEHLERLYRAIYAATGSKAIIDSSKSLTCGHILGTPENIELYVVHLIRDPRGVRYSLLKRKELGHRLYLSHGSAKGSLAWNVLDLATEAIWRNSPHPYMRLRFEDFVREP